MFASTTTSVGGTTQTVDWDSLFTANGTPAGSERGATAKDPLPAGFDAAGFDFDFNVNANGSFNTSDGSTFSTGSKDTLNITPGWQCGYSANVNSKTDVMNSYATSYTADGTGGATAGDEILYFALERNTNTGTGNVGFWFLQDEVACEATRTSGNVPFTGDHVDGDILVVSEFSNGGAVSTIQAYRWSGGADGFLDPNPVAGGANLDCDSITGGDSICANVNTETINNIPWLTANFKDGVGHTLRSTEFFEAGLNLTEEGLGGKCFNTFIADTRSSTSLTATIFDFSLGTLGACTSGIDTTPSTGSDSLVAPGTLVHDNATITVSGTDTFGGTVSFYLCGPTTGTTYVLCETGGTVVNGTEVGALNPPVAVTGAAGTATVQSSSITVTATGRYCWRGVYSGDADAGVPGSTDFTVDECFRVADTSSMTTAQNWLPNDSATITSGVAGTTLAGNAVFTLYDGAITCATPGSATVLYTESVPVSGGSPATVTTSKHRHEDLRGRKQDGDLESGLHEYGSQCGECRTEVRDHDHRHQ